jgi:seryl-tRNA(Sec) selenium transferase
VLPSGVTASVEADRGAVGGGSLPGVALDTWVVALRSRGALSSDAIARALRAAAVPVLARVRDDAVAIDLRTLQGDDAKLVEEAVRTLR